MSKKWVQAENGADQKLDIFVLVDVSETVGTASVVDSYETADLLGPDGRPVRSQPKRSPMGFQPPVKS